MSTNGCFVKQCTKCGATTLRGSANCPWCGVEQEREVFKAPAPVSSDWLLTPNERSIAAREWDNHPSKTLAEAVARAQLRKVAIEGEKPCPHDPCPPENKRLRKRQCSFCQAILLQEAGLEVEE